MSRPGSRNSAATAALETVGSFIQASASRIRVMTSPVPLVLSAFVCASRFPMVPARRTPQYCRPWSGSRTTDDAMARMSERIAVPVLAEIATAGSLGRAARAIGLAAIAAYAVLGISQLLTHGWWAQDAQAYWNAAERLRAGGDLYPAVANIDASDVYRYAPWFAGAWIPLTLLPKGFAMAAWIGMLFGVSAASVVPLLRAQTLASLALAVLATALLVPAAASGNVQPLLVFALLYGVERQSGPLWIAVAASLKATPLLLVAVYLGRRQWRRAALAGILTAVLVAPMLFFDLSHYPAQVGAATGPLGGLPLAAAAGVAALLAVRLGRGRYGWLAASAATLAAMPRWSYYQPTFLLVALARPPRASDE